MRTHISDPGSNKDIDVQPMLSTRKQVKGAGGNKETTSLAFSADSALASAGPYLPRP